MKRICCLFSEKWYGIRKQYPLIVDMERRMKEVKKELNRGQDKCRR